MARGRAPARAGARASTWLALALLGCGAAPDPPPPGGRVLVPRGAAWHFTSDPALAGAGWADTDFDAASWSQGAAPLGYGRDGLATTLERPQAGDGRMAAFFRHAFQVPAGAEIDGLVLDLQRDDGALVFLNGREVLRSNMPGGRVHADTRAARSVGGELEDRTLRNGLPGDLVRPGRNVLAAAVHQSRPTSSDLLFEASLVGYAPDAPLALLRGPYLQRLTDRAVTIRWTTNRTVRGRIRFGARADALDREVLAPEPAREHELTLTGLAPGRRVHYAVGSPDADLSGGHRFTSAPPPGARTPTRIWVIGDAGTGDDHARAVRDAALDWSDGRDPDVWLTLGDNAYPSGTPSDYQANFFEVYRELLPRIAVWPALGNHDANARAPLHREIAYFRLFTLPGAGEAGGVPSGSESYYAFDHGNVHFVVLDSDKSDRGPDGPMLRWLRRDLAQRRGDWLIASFHHAPFSRGTHADEDGIQAMEMRAFAVPLLEQAGVDLVLSGHEHVYERSALLRGPHPGRWSRDPARVVDARPGRRDADGPYRTGPGGAPGSVYAVVGSSGLTGPGPLDHPAMVTSLQVHGSLLIDVDACELDAVFVDEEGDARDRFAISKGSACTGAGAAEPPRAPGLDPAAPD